MNEITVKPLEAMSEKQIEAQQLHMKITANGQLAASAFVEFCKDLKRMRDEKLYSQLGYETFDDYAVQAVGIKQRQAYSYISTYEKLGSTVLQSNATLGITKLELLAQINPVEREDFVAEHNLEEMSTRELKEAVARANEAEEQLSMLQEENQSLKEQVEAKGENDEAQELKAKLAELEKKLKQASSSTEPDPALIDKQVKKAVKEAEKESKQKLATLEKEKEQAIKAAKEKAVREANERIEKLLSEKHETELQLESALKKAKINNADPQLIEINFVFQDLQSTAKKLTDLIDVYGNKEPEQAKKLRDAVVGTLVGIQAELED